MKKKILSTILAVTVIFTAQNIGLSTVYADEMYVENNVNDDSQEEVDENCQMGMSSRTEELYNSVPTGYDEVIHDEKFSGYTKRKGIDVSRHQGTIDWKKVKASGVEFAIVRVGYRTYKESGNLFTDNMAEQNIKGAKEAGLKVGVYIYSQAVNVSEAREEADYAIDQLKGEYLDLPVVFDYEFYTDGRLEKANLSKEEGTAIANAFCTEVVNKGYVPMVYANKYMLENFLYADKISNNYNIWLANYTNKTSYEGEYTFWQFSESGNVDGISSSSVDLDFWYDNGKSMNSGDKNLKKAPDGSWKYYDNDKINVNYTGLVKKADKWFYVKNGSLNWDYTGFVKHIDGNWYYVKNSVVDFGANGLKKHTDGNWYYTKNGVIKFAFIGLAKNGIQWFYVKNGVVQWGHNGFVKNIDGNWYYVRNSVVDFNVNGLVKHSDGNWYNTKAGVINFSYTGLVKNGTQWFRVKNGVIDWDYSGFVKHTDENWYYVKNSVVDFDANGLRLHSDGNYYYTRRGIINWNYSGKARTPDDVRMRVRKGVAI